VKKNSAMAKRLRDITKPDSSQFGAVYLGYMYRR
jgi:hypothetical protein